MSQEQELRTALQEARNNMQAMNEDFARIAENALSPATVLTVSKDMVMVAKGQDLLAIKPPQGVILNEGETILVTRDSGQYVKHMDALSIGDVCVVNRELDKVSVEVSIGGSQAAVLRGQLAAAIKEGDRVVLDKSRSVILKHFEGEGARFDFTAPTNVSWNDIGGQVEAKKDLIEAVELPKKHPEVFKFYGKRPIKGVLLEGPPGCGKTMLGKAVATSIGGTAASFLYVKGAEILDPYVGVAEATIRSLFARSREHKAKTGMPSVIFIDEADALLGRRGERNSHMEKTIVPTFLAEMDGLDESSAVVILATNRAGSLDTAITREGRMDRKVRVTRPDRNDAIDILKLYLSKVPVADSTTRGAMIETTCEAIYGHSKAYYDARMDDGKTHTFSLAHIVSGAMLAGIVDQASSLALNRDLVSGTAPAGVSMEDMQAAVERVYQQNLNVDHKEALTDFAGNSNIVELKRRSEQYVKAA